MLLALLLYLLSVLYFYFRGLESFMLAVLFFMTLSNKNTPYSVKEEIYQQHFPIPNICEKTHNTQNSIKETLLGLTLQTIINTIILRNSNAPFSQIIHLKTKQNPQILKEFS